MIRQALKSTKFAPDTSGSSKKAVKKLSRELMGQLGQTGVEQEETVTETFLMDEPVDTPVETPRAKPKKRTKKTAKVPSSVEEFELELPVEDHR